MTTREWYEEADLEDPRERRIARPKQAKPTLAQVEEEENGPGGPLASFFADELIVGEPTVVKSGKEATVYCCRAHPSTGKEWLAAKVYRPRAQRSFKNDGVYQQGRTTLDARADRAIANRTNKGLAMQFQQWISCEYATLRILHEAGADVPKAWSSASSALLLDYYGEPGMAAPQLINVELAREEVPRLFEQLLRNLELFLEFDRVHGDLSPYNILYWQGELRVIDFPQAVEPEENTHAYALFARDVANVCEYFALYGVQTDPPRLAWSLWRDSGRGRP